jgi:hypothetical protein
MSRWNEFMKERREHREIRQKLQSDDFELV